MKTLAFLLFSAPLLAQNAAVVEYEGKDSTKFAALAVKPEISPRLRLWFPPTTAVYQVKIVHFDGTETTHLLDMKGSVAPGAGPLVPQTWLEAGITLPLGGPPQSVSISAMVVGSAVATSVLK